MGNKLTIIHRQMSGGWTSMSKSFRNISKYTALDARFARSKEFCFWINSCFACLSQMLYNPKW